MSDVFKIGVNLALTGPIERQLVGIAGLFDKLGKDALRALSGVHVGKGAFESVAKLRSEIHGISGVTGKVGVSITADMAKAMGAARADAGTVKAAIASWGTEVAAVEAKIKGLGGMMGSVTGRMARPSIRAGGGHGGGHGGGGFGRVLDAAAFGPTESGIFAGVGIDRFAGGLLHANAELQRQVNLYRLAGNTDTDAAAGVRSAHKSSVEVPSVGVTEQFKLLRELSSATQDSAGSRDVLSAVAKSRSVIEAATGHVGDEGMRRLFKFIELRGTAIDETTHKINPLAFQSELNYGTKALVAGQGLITSNDLLQFQKQAGPMAKNIGPEELYATYLASIEDMGGARTGTSLSAIGRQFLGGIMTPKIASHWRDLGMLNKAGWHDDGGKVIIDDPSKAIKGYDILGKEGLGALVEKIVRPILEQHGIKGREAQNKELYQFGSTETGRRALSLYLSSQEQVAAVASRFRQTMGSEGFDKVLGGGGDYGTSSKALEESIHTLKTALGDAGAVAPLMMTLAKGIASFADVVKGSPGVGTTATLGTMGAGVGLLGYGALKTMTGFGLPAAAAQLSTAAVALDAAAVKLGGGSVAGNVAKAAGAAGVGIGVGGLALGAGVVAGGLAAGAAAGAMKMPMVDDFGRVTGNWGGGGSAGNPAAIGSTMKSLGEAAKAAAPALDTTRSAIDKIAPAANPAAGALSGLTGAISSFVHSLGSAARAVQSAPIPMVPGKQSFNAPSGGATSAQHVAVVVHHTTTLDGRTIAQNTTHHMAQMARYPTEIGGMDSYGSWRPPGTTLTDAA